MTREQYLDYWRAMSPAEKRLELGRFALDLCGGIALIVGCGCVFAVLPELVTAVWWAWDSLTGWL